MFFRNISEPAPRHCNARLVSEGFKEEWAPSQPCRRLSEPARLPSLCMCQAGPQRDMKGWIMFSAEINLSSPPVLGAKVTQPHSLLLDNTRSVPWVSGEAGPGQQGRRSKASLTGEGTCGGLPHDWEGPRAALSPCASSRGPPPCMPLTRGGASPVSNDPHPPQRVGLQSLHPPPRGSCSHPSYGRQLPKHSDQRAWLKMDSAGQLLSLLKQYWDSVLNPQRDCSLKNPLIPLPPHLSSPGPSPSSSPLRLSFLQ